MEVCIAVKCSIVLFKENGFKKNATQTFCESDSVDESESSRDYLRCYARIFLTQNLTHPHARSTVHGRDLCSTIECVRARNSMRQNEQIIGRANRCAKREGVGGKVTMWLGTRMDEDVCEGVRVVWMIPHPLERARN